MSKGVLYGVGTGPGDPELLTIKAVRTIESCPVIAAPQTADGAISWIGGQAVGLIQQFMSDASNFEPKGKIQRERYPSYADSPLMVTGRLRNSITWEVEE